MATEVLDNVPAAQLCAVVESFFSESDATRVVIDDKGNGSYTVTATVPD